MYRFSAYLFALLAILTSAGLIYLAYQYETVGHGLHPAIGVLGILLMLCCSVFMLRTAPELDAYEPEGFDITNDIYSNH